jgi:hypothetical protein
MKILFLTIGKQLERNDSSARTEAKKSIFLHYTERQFQETENGNARLSAVKDLRQGEP